MKIYPNENLPLYSSYTIIMRYHLGTGGLTIIIDNELAANIGSNTKEVGHVYVLIITGLSRDSL